MHPETLNRIEQLVNADALRNAISTEISDFLGNQSKITPTVVLPDGKIIDCEPYAPARARPRGAFATHSIGAFAAFLGEQGTKAPVLVDITSLSAVAFLDHGVLARVVSGEDPQGHCKFTAKVQARATAPWIALQIAAAPPTAKVTSKPARFDQQQLAEWLIDWRGYIEGAFDDDVAPDSLAVTPLSLARAAAAIRAIKVKASGERTSVVGGLAREAAAKESLRIEGDAAQAFPTAFRFVMAPYIGFRVRTIDVRLNTYIEDDKPPTFSLSIIGYDALVEDLANEFADLIREAVPQDRADILLGTFAT